MRSFELNLVLILVCILWNNTYALADRSYDVLKHLGTRTPYRFKYNKNDSRIKYPGCEDRKIWMLVRHGTRLPSAQNIIGMNTTLKDLKYQILLHREKGRLSNEELEEFEDWTVNVDVTHEKYLTFEGQEEMILLAERVQNRFPNAVREKYDNETFVFRYTATQRAQQSAKHFTIGLFDKKNSQDVIFSPAVKIDPVLRVLEYYYDLKHYWVDGYGYHLTYRQACLAVKTMFENFSSKKGPNATFLFAHSGTLLKVLSHMLLYRPDFPLRADNMQDSRPWKTSDIDCFASNLAFVLYKWIPPDTALCHGMARMHRTHAPCQLHTAPALRTTLHAAAAPCLPAACRMPAARRLPHHLPDRHHSADSSHLPRIHHRATAPTNAHAHTYTHAGARTP
ncbi:Multiple inositol polyphosphate phosphatase 1 [Eumeta japonica]|uniref:Multiple inositol polyphosphate phosphatase 1 n=1 Tax=Eumeta variegata TaxID=151549 RepID=A0A4C1VXA3_EUMVA|nr:Multiple inositol polyphosphate phosphatase 1 [Eumeta japonica]